MIYIELIFTIFLSPMSVLKIIMRNSPGLGVPKFYSVKSHLTRKIYNKVTNSDFYIVGFHSTKKTHSQKIQKSYKFRRFIEHDWPRFQKLSTLFK